MSKDNLKPGESSGAVAGAVVSGIATGGTGTYAGFKAGLNEGRNIGRKIDKLKKTKDFLKNDADSISGRFIKSIIERIIPVPFLDTVAAESIDRIKGHLFIFVLAIIIFLSTLLGGFGLSSVYGVPYDFGQLPEELKGYIEENYYDNEMPRGTPFGGKDFQYTLVTAYYRDVEYYNAFGRWHTGMDLVPSVTYYSENKGYLLLKKKIVYATHSGKACSFGSDSSGFTVTIVSKNEKYKSLYHHQTINFIPLNECADITAGQPIGIMGQTGNATGPHVHYEVYVKNNNGKWDIVDPLSYLYN